MARLHLLRPPDLAARAARPPALARRHRPQRGQRQHRRATRARRPSSAPRRAHAHPRRRASRRLAARSSAPASRSQDYRRIRDGFLDVQYRAQAARARRRRREGALARGRRPRARRAGRERHRPPARASSGARGRTSPTTRRASPARQSLIEQAKTVATAFADLDRQLATLAGPGRDELATLVAYDPAAGRRARSPQIAYRARAGSATSIRDAVLTRPDAERPDRPPRPAARPALRSSARVSVLDLGDGGIRVLFGGRGEPLVDDHAVDDPRRPATTASAGTRRAAHQRRRQARRAARPREHRRHHRQLPHRARRASPTSLATPVNDDPRRRPAPCRFFTFDPALRAPGPVASTAHASADDRPAAPAPRAEANDLALRIAALRGGAADDAYARSSPASAPRSTRTSRPGQRRGARQRGRGPPPVGLRRLARRGDDEPHPLPARLPGVGANDVDARRDARRPHQPHRTRGPLETMPTRITALIAVARRPRRHRRGERAPRARRRSSCPRARSSRGPPTTRPRVARALQLRTRRWRAPSSTSERRREAPGLDRRDRHARSTHDRRRAAARRASSTVQAPTTPPAPSRARRSPRSSSGLIDTIKTAGNATYGGRYVFAGTETDDQPVRRWAPPTPTAATTETIEREIGPGVARPGQRRRPRRRSATTTGGLLATMRTVLDHLDGRRPATALCGRPRRARRRASTSSTPSARTVGATSTASRSRRRAWPSTRAPRSQLLTTPRTPTSPRR